MCSAGLFLSSVVNVHVYLLTSPEASEESVLPAFGSTNGSDQFYVSLVVWEVSAGFFDWKLVYFIQFWLTDATRSELCTVDISSVFTEKLMNCVCISRLYCSEKQQRDGERRCGRTCNNGSLSGPEPGTFYFSLNVRWTFLTHHLPLQRL